MPAPASRSGCARCGCRSISDCARQAARRAAPGSRATRRPTPCAISADGSRRSSSGGGKGSVWRLLSPQLVAERSGNDKLAADAVVVARSATPQQGRHRAVAPRLLRGARRTAACPRSASRRRGPRRRLSTRSTRRACRASISWRREVGRFALALLLAGGRPGSYGLKQTATDGILPPIDAARRGEHLDRSGDGQADDPHRRARRGGSDRKNDRARSAPRCPTRS